MLITARDLPDCWFRLLELCLSDVAYEQVIQRGSYENQQTRLQLPFVAAEITHPGIRPLIPDIPPGVNIPPPTSMEFVEEYLDYLINPAARKENEDYTYADSIYPQLEPVIEMLSNTPQTNQACISIGRPESIKLKDPECLRCLDFKVVNGKLNVHVVFRSNDLFNAWSANLAGIQLMKEQIAEASGLQDGKIFYSSAGLHLYKFSEELAKLRIGETDETKTETSK